MIRTLSNSKFLIPSMILLAILAAGAGFYISLKQSQQTQQTTVNIEGLFWPNPKKLSEFSTLDHTGQAFGKQQMQEKWSLIFFGYTHCPDICPVTMSVMTDVYNQLSVANKNIQVIFATVDPERDTTEKLQSYVNYFNKDFIGLGGSTEMVDSLTKQIGIAYYVNKDEATQNYLVDHSASIFLFDTQGRLVGKLSPPHQKEKILDQFNQIKNFVMDNS